MLSLHRGDKMASVMIHLAVAKEINKTIHQTEKDFLLGSIAPDLSRQLGQSKERSHFIDTIDDPELKDIPNLNRFLEKYQSKLNHPFILGYYVHLYTDYLWFKYFIPEFQHEKSITLLNGETLPLSREEGFKYIYNDYTDLNIKLLDAYHMDLSLFYEPLSLPEIEMDEIPIDQLSILVDKMGVIIQNSKQQKNYVFNLNQVKQFIKTTTEMITSDILEKQKKL